MKAMYYDTKDSKMENVKELILTDLGRIYEGDRETYIDEAKKTLIWLSEEYDL